MTGRWTDEDTRALRAQGRCLDCAVDPSLVHDHSAELEQRAADEIERLRARVVDLEAAVGASRAVLKVAAKAFGRETVEFLVEDIEELQQDVAALECGGAEMRASLDLVCRERDEAVEQGIAEERARVVAEAKRVAEAIGPDDLPFVTDDWRLIARAAIKQALLGFADAIERGEREG